MAARHCLVLALTLALVGCLRSTSHQCSDELECGDGVCEPSGFCSFADPGCNGGRRYGDGAGELAGTCVGDGPGADGGDGDPERDRDNDGVDDGFDNCPELANAGQYDEDGDNVGDVCDNCPHIGNVAQLDIQETIDGGQADGVGDDCDPSPRDGGDRLVLFDGFNEPPAPGMWTTNGAWSIDQGAARFTDPASRGTLSRPIVGATDPHIVIAALTIESVASGDTLLGAGVLVDAQPMNDTGIGCIVSRSGIGTSGARIVELPTATERSVAQLNGVPLIGTRFSVNYRSAIANQSMSRPCSVTTMGATVLTNSAFLLPNPGAHLGLFAHRVTVSYEYVVVISDAP